MPTLTRPLAFLGHSEAEMTARATALFDCLKGRRSVRHFSEKPIPFDVVRRCIEIAAQAPSGAHKQPWTFCLVSNPELKSQIRAAAEAEERAFYSHRAPDEWLAALQPIGTTAEKAFLENAPALIAVFAHQRAHDGSKNYYVNESVGIAAGFLIAALHHAGLATLTHTPSPMRFLSELLGRPRHERAYLLMPVGYPADDCPVPVLNRKNLSDVLVEYP